MKFFKLNSIGNDFVAVEFLDVAAIEGASRLAKELCDRKYGIGADQAIFFAYDAAQQSAKVRFFNQDGSEAEMCGNGMRALGLLMKKLYATSSLKAETIASVVDIQVDQDDIIQTKTEILPLKYSDDYVAEIARYIRQKLPAAQHINVVNVGNPHIDIFMPDNGYVSDDLVANIGAAVDHFVAGGINVGFIGIRDNELFLKVWERGAGFTLGCGSGACAAAFSAKKLNLSAQNDILIHQIGGDLRIVIDDQFAITQGTAEIIFEGMMHER